MDINQAIEILDDFKNAIKIYVDSSIYHQYVNLTHLICYLKNSDDCELDKWREVRNSIHSYHGLRYGMLSEFYIYDQDSQKMFKLNENLDILKCRLENLYDFACVLLD